MPGIDSYSKTAMEQAMKVQEVLRAVAKKITWWQAAEFPRIAPTLCSIVCAISACPDWLG